MQYIVSIKRSDLRRLEALIRINKVELLTPTLCYKAEGSSNFYAHYIWPRAWGIKGRKDGWGYFTSHKLTKEEALKQLEMSLEEIEGSFTDPNIEYIIDEEIFSNN